MLTKKQAFKNYVLLFRMLTKFAIKKTECAHSIRRNMVICLVQSTQSFTDRYHNMMIFSKDVIFFYKISLFKN